MPLPLTGSSFSEIQIGFTFLVPAHLGSPELRAIKRGVCVCVCVRVCVNAQWYQSNDSLQSHETECLQFSPIYTAI